MIVTVHVSGLATVNDYRVPTHLRHTSNPSERQPKAPLELGSVERGWRRDE
jgi:hypothetical protein